ncbi:hypothetical protein [Nocardiopsis baichengensis]|uniref:hypothetical protein n=1 Tax=Nocardiopsis baichengensis TaxID=280240 RepID=UPI00034D79F0|nr:hypothetical protein [Nocardiopsis baichengensis]
MAQPTHVPTLENADGLRTVQVTGPDQPDLPAPTPEEHHQLAELADVLGPAAVGVWR